MSKENEEVVIDAQFIKETEQDIDITEFEKDLKDLNLESEE